MRFFPLVACLPLCLTAQDAKEIVSRSVELNRKNIEICRNYSYVERRQQRWLDGSGKVKSTDRKTWSVTWQEGSPYRRLVARNDQPLPPGEQRKEDEKLRACVEERRNETGAERQRRIAEWVRRQDRRYEPAREMLNGFDFKLAGEEKLNGGDAYVIDATPRPGFTPKSRSLFYLPKLKARLWIDKNDFQWIKIDAETLDTVSFGGFLLRMAKGGHILLEQQRVNNEVWLPKHVLLAGSGRIALIKTIRGDLDISFGNYRRTWDPEGPADALNLRRVLSR